MNEKGVERERQQEERKNEGKKKETSMGLRRKGLMERRQERNMEGAKEEMSDRIKVRIKNRKIFQN